MIDRNLRKNEESGTLAHPGLRGWLRPCKMVFNIINCPPAYTNSHQVLQSLTLMKFSTHWKKKIIIVCGRFEYSRG